MGGSNELDEPAINRRILVRPRRALPTELPNDYTVYETSYSHDEDVINAAIKQLGSEGGVVQLAAGRYKIESSINITSNLVLTGDGHATRLEGYGSGFAIILGVGNNKDTPFVHVEVSNMMLDGTNMVDTGGFNVFTKGIYIIYMRYARFLNLYIYNTPATSLGADFMDSSIIHGCIIERGGRQFKELGGVIGGNGIGVGTGGYEYESVTISDCHAIDTGNNGIMFEQQFSQPNSGHMLVSNCLSRGSGGAGYRFSGTHHAILSNSQSVANDTDGVIISDSYCKDSPQASSIKICNSHIVANRRHGVHILTEQEATRGSKDYLSIGNNEISNNAGNGVMVRGAHRDLRIESNTITLNGAKAVDVNHSDDSGLIVNTVVRNNTGYNPVGMKQVDIPTWPFTYTAGSSPETVYISGALRWLEKDDVVIPIASSSTATSYTIALQPHQHLLIDYSISSKQPTTPQRITVDIH